MTLARQQTRRRIEPDPSRARYIDFGPGVQIAEVRRGADRPLEGCNIGLELDEIARDEAGGETKLAEDLHQQPCAVSAGPRCRSQCFFGRLHARFHADEVLDVLL